MKKLISTLIALIIMAALVIITWRDQGYLLLGM